MFYGDYMKMCKNFAQKFGDKRTGSFITHFLFHRGIFNQNLDCHSLPTLLSSVSPNEGRHFDTIEVTEAEPQAVLNSLTEHDFQDAFQKWQKL
jgi:hypothetical protein